MPKVDTNGQDIGGPGGLVTADGSRRTMAARRERRLVRRVEAAKLKLAESTAEHVEGDTGDSLGALREGLTAKSAGITVTLKSGATKVVAECPDYRERRLSAATILQHHREVVKLASPVKPSSIHVGDVNQTLTVETGPADMGKWLADIAGRLSGRNGA